MVSSNTDVGGDTDSTADTPAVSSADDDHPGSSSGRVSLSRRSTLALLGLGGLGLLGSETGAAQQPARPWQTDVDANGNSLLDLGSLSMRDNPTAITDFAGTNLSIDASGVLNATDTDTDTRTNVSDDGTQVVADTLDINFASNLSVTDDGDGSVTVGLTNDSITITPGDHLTGGGTVALGQSVMLNVTDDWVDIDGDTMQGSLNMGTNDVSNVGSFATVDNPTPITDFAGTNLSIDANGVLNVTDTEPDTRTNVSDDGSQVVTDTLDINFASNLSVTDDGDGSVTVDASGSPWADNDGDGLLGASGFDGIDVDRVKANNSVQTPQVGTTTDTPLEAVVNSERALRIEPTASELAPNLVGGYLENSTASGNAGATIAGGGYVGSPNTAASFGTVGGGADNRASGSFSTIPGGEQNRARGLYSFATGFRAETQTSGGTSHDGAVVFGDSSTNTVRSQRDNQFVVQAGGGATIYSSSDLSAGVNLPPGGGSWSSLSTRTAKTNVRPVDPGSVLASVENLELSTWEYDSEEDAIHMGPMAEDFHAAFSLGDSERRISTVDADGVALAAIQGLSARLDEKGDRLDELARDVERKDDRIEALERTNSGLRERCETLERRLTALEAKVTGGAG